ncbi:MAG: hypothetical protein MRQ13_02190 [Candidatus Midichloria sp.]|nr:hypothetical protein [Candidatus Midichloria sp.]
MFGWPVALNDISMAEEVKKIDALYSVRIASILVMIKKPRRTDLDSKAFKR